MTISFYFYTALTFLFLVAMAVSVIAGDYSQFSMLVYLIAAMGFSIHSHIEARK